MANIGLKMLYVAVKNEDGTTVVDAVKGVSETGVYAIDTNKSHMNLGAKTANISNLSGTPTKITGNNEVVDVTNPPASPTVAITANLINPEVKQKLLGRAQLSDSGLYVDQDKPTYAADYRNSKPYYLRIRVLLFRYGCVHRSHSKRAD